MDTASRERFQSLTAGYYRRANLVLMVCSLDSEFTLTRLTKWYAEAQHYIDDADVVYAVVGMKSDLAEHEREVTSDMLNGFAAHYNIGQNHVFEVSARTGKGVNNMLKVLCTAVVEQYRRGPAARGILPPKFALAKCVLQCHIAPSVRPDFSCCSDLCRE